VKALRVIYLALGASTASLSVFIAVILQERGLSSQLVGLVSGAGALGLFAAIAFWAQMPATWSVNGSQRAQRRLSQAFRV
jgi:threonine dehydrogenase-like Zn-dependent dehydrogenase